MNTFSDPYDFETIHGLKSIELWCADLTNFHHSIDVLVVSAYQNSYLPVKHSLIGALLENKKIDVSELAKSPEIDLRQSQHVWLSRELDVDTYHIRRIACIEMKKFGDKSINISNIKKSMIALFGMFAAAQYANIKLETVAMPLLGSGIQHISPEDVIRVLLQEGKRGLMNIQNISKLLLIDTDTEKMFNMSTAMNKYLGRTALDVANIPLDDYTKHLTCSVVRDLSTTVSLCQQENNKVVNYDIIFDVLNKLKNVDNCKGFELSIQCRRILEVICCDLENIKKVKGRSTPDYLAGKIDVLAKNYNMADWIKSYFHLLRILGNTSAHDFKNTKKPREPEINDLRILLHCLAIVVTYWKNIKTGQI